MSKRYLSGILFAGAVALLAATTAHAGIVYDVSRTVGASEITGHIETDGTLGTIGRTAVIDWQLDIFSFFGPTAATMTPSDSDLVFLGSGFQATATELVFDFNQLDSISFIGTTGAQWCLGGTDSGCTSPSTEVLATISGTDSAAHTGSEVIGVASVPVPVAAWLSGSGLLALAAMARPGKAAACKWSEPHST